MKVILLQDIKGLGKKNDVKDVSLGYARNFLLPRNLAEVATGVALSRLMEARTQSEEEKKKLIAVLEGRKEKIKGMTFEFKVKVGKEGGVFSSVSARDIEGALAEKGIPNATVELKKPLKELGEHSIGINLGEGVHTQVMVLLEAEK
jgi:large subunit ribosomal protein L9